MAAIIVGDTGTYLSGLSSGSLDAATGESTATLVYVVSDLAGVFSVGQTLHPELGIPEVSRSWSQLEGCMGYEVSIKYEGKLQEGADADEYTLDVSFSEEPIESHPNWDRIKKEYRGSINSEGEVEFQEYIRMPKKLNTLPGSKGFSKNPMLGHKTWMALRAVIRHTYTSKRRPNLNMIGKIVKRAPGGYETPEGHDWLVMPPKARKKSGGKDPDQERFEITVEYLLSPMGGWPEAVYTTMEGKFSPDEEKEREFNAPRNGDAPFVPKTGWNL